MWPFSRKRKLSSKELAKYIAISTVTNRVGINLFKDHTILTKKELLFETNILDMVIMHFVVKAYFDFNENQYMPFLSHYTSYCHDRMVAMRIIERSFDFNTAFVTRLNEYQEALHDDMSSKSCLVTGRKMCEYFGVPHTDIRYCFPAAQLFVKYIDATRQAFSGLMKIYKIDETSEFTFDEKHLIYDFRNLRIEAEKEAMGRRRQSRKADG